MSCHHVPGGLQDLLDETWGGNRKQLRILPQAAAPIAPAPPAKAPAAPLSPYQLSKKIEKTIDEYVRPLMRRDGGDVEIVDIKDFLVYCRMVGACQGCRNASQTSRMMIEQTLKDLVDERVRVIDV